MAQERRLARFAVAPEVLVYMAVGAFRVVDNPLPADARIVAAHYDGRRDVFEVILASDEYKPVKVGNIIPWCAAPAIEKLDCDGCGFVTGLTGAEAH